MKKIALFLSAFAVVLCVSVLLSAEVKKEATTSPEWHMNATAIEACSCPMFCQCYFNTKPAAHHSHEGASKHYCRANLAYKINKGNYGSVNLDGAKFWIVTDLGGDFSTGEMDWAVVYFDKPLSKEQRDAIATMAGALFPVKWKSLTTGEGNIDKWEFTNDSAVATMDGGKTAEVRLKRMPGMTNEPVVIKNLVYWGAARNDGFVLMPNEVEAYRVGPNAFEYKGTNGFMITLDLTSEDVAKRAAATGSH
ncbi:DUF1326 domain-containing protein [bacterium]|nr:DUF1326 domain-containing protein [bacterium]